MNTRVDPHSSGIPWIPLPPNPINQGGDKVNKAINNIAGLFHKHGIPFDQVRGGDQGDGVLSSLNSILINDRLKDLTLSQLQQLRGHLTDLYNELRESGYYESSNFVPKSASGTPQQGALHTKFKEFGDKVEEQIKQLEKPNNNPTITSQSRSLKVGNNNPTPENKKMENVPWTPELREQLLRQQQIPPELGLHSDKALILPPADFNDFNNTEGTINVTPKAILGILSKNGVIVPETLHDKTPLLWGDLFSPEIIDQLNKDSPSFGVLSTIYPMVTGKPWNGKPIPPGGETPPHNPLQSVKLTQEIEDQLRNQTDNPPGMGSNKPVIIRGLGDSAFINQTPGHIRDLVASTGGLDLSHLNHPNIVWGDLYSPRVIGQIDPNNPAHKNAFDFLLLTYKAITGKDWDGKAIEPIQHPEGEEPWRSSNSKIDFLYNGTKETAGPNAVGYVLREIHGAKIPKEFSTWGELLSPDVLTAIRGISDAAKRDKALALYENVYKIVTEN
jgi:hypothetical protein